MDSNLTNERIGPELYRFDSHENLALYNPRLLKEQLKELEARLNLAKHLQGHIFVLSSGTTSARGLPKWIALSKRAILASAEASNATLNESSDDVWLHLLPEFHVGGMGIWARSHLSGSRVVKAGLVKWSASCGLKAMGEARATLVSLVPAQVHDLVQLGAPAPPTLRAVLVGGGRIEPTLFQSARQLGWPLLRTYGMTETASQAATEDLNSLDAAPPDEPEFWVLPHLEADCDSESRIKLRGESLLSGWIVEGANHKAHFEDPKNEAGWFTTQDLGDVEGRRLRVTGRSQSIVKVLGELVSLVKLESILTTIAGVLSQELAIVPLPDSRRGVRLVLAISPLITDAQAIAIQAAFADQVMPYERIQAVARVAEIPRTELGKVMSNTLLQMCIEASPPQRN